MAEITKVVPLHTAACPVLASALWQGPRALLPSRPRPLFFLPVAEKPRNRHSTSVPTGVFTVPLGTTSPKSINYIYYNMFWPSKWFGIVDSP
jgi:hypothetical protein